MHPWLKWYAHISVDYYSANSANYCDAEKETCQCSLMNGKCTGAEICRRDGTCKGNHNEMIKMHIVIKLLNEKLIRFLNLLILDPALGLIIEASCHNTYDSDGYLMSPNYPQQCENDLDCRWTIKAPVGKIIALTISEFRTDTVEGDNLRIYLGSNIHGVIVGTLPAYDPIPLLTTGNSLYLRFSTNSYSTIYTQQGFKIKADAVGKYL